MTIIDVRWGCTMMTTKRLLAALAGVAAIAGPGIGGAAATPARCERSCLYDVLDRYLDALRARDAGKVPWAPTARVTENNVALKPGDGLWATVTGLGRYQLRFADPVTGAIGFHGVVEESGARSPFAVRLSVKNGRITEAETVVVRMQDAGTPFTSPDLVDKPVLNEIVPPEHRSTRARMITLADGYFETLQRNDGTLHTEFDPACSRRENGFQTTSNPEGAAKYGFIMGLSCAEQFKLGYFRFDDRLRGRRVVAVDEERGLVMMSAFIDHSGRLGEYRLTDGRTEMANIHRPHSFYLLETFKIRDGRIQQVEANFTTVPYRMPSPWGAAGFRYE